MQALVDSLVSLLLLEAALLKRHEKIAREPSPAYDPSWVIDADKFSASVFYLEEITANFHVINSSLQQSITSVVSFTMATAVAAIETRHKNKMLALRKLIEKSLLLKEFPFANPAPDLDAAPKALPGADFLPKTSAES